jgi:hypothetical protein
MLSRSPDIRASFRLKGAFYEREARINGVEVSFAQGNPVNLTGAETAILSDILTRLKASNPEWEYAAGRTASKRPAYELEVTAPPTLVMSIRAADSNPRTPTELREFSSLISDVARRLR